MCFKEGGGPDAVFNFGKYEGQTFAAAYLKDLYYAEWASKQDKWKLESFKDFILRLSNLERVMKRERGPEETERVIEAECMVEEMAREEVKVVEKHRVRWADVVEDSEVERVVTIEEREEQREMAQRGELEMAEEREWEGKAAQDGGTGGDGGTKT